MTLPRTADAALARARVLVVGVGGLGAPAVMALAAAGIGGVGLVDPDVVEASNLHRQPPYDEAALGDAKVEAAARHLRRVRPALDVTTLSRRVGAGDAELVAGFSAVIDGTDSIEAKFLVNDLAVATGRPLVHAGVAGLRGQLMTVLPGATACYRCIFEEPPPPGDAVSCTEAGVLGPLPALLGALQAAEAVRLCAGEPPLFADRLLAIDASRGTWRSVPLARRVSCAACGPRPPAPAATRSDSP
jgi:molybdopterin/thiamine biosynthesis adenylyltransferase